MTKLLPVIFISLLAIFSCVNLVNAPINVGVIETVFENKVKNILLYTMNHFAPGQFIQIVMSDSYYSPSWFWDDLVMKDLFEKWSIVITNQNEKLRGVISDLPDVFIISFKDYQSLINILNYNLINISESWNPEAKFLLITDLSYMHSKLAMDEFSVSIFNYLWSRNVLRVSLLILNKNTKTASLFSSSPYSKIFKTCKKVVTLSQLQVINSVNNNKSRLIKIAGYQFETPTSFLGCSLVGHTFPFPPYSVADINSSNCYSLYRSGIEVQLVKLLANVYNFSLEILSTPGYGTTSEWMHQYPNGTKIGMLEDIMQYKIDLAFAGAIPATLFYFRLSLTGTYIDSSMSWYVPGGEMVPMWKLVLNTFSVVTWLFMLSVLFVVTILYYLMRGFELSKDEKPVDLTMVALSLGLSISWTKNTSLRIMLLAWSLFCVHVVLMFNTRLFSVLTEHPFESEIETVQQLHDSKLKPCTYSSYKGFYTNRTDGVMRDLVRNAHVCDHLDEAIKHLLKYKNLSILAKDDHMAFKIDKKSDKIHKLKYDKFINYPVVMYVAKGSTFLGILNRLVINVTESGLVLKWLWDVQQKVKNNTTEVQGLCKAETNLMTREDFIWLYFLFLVGQSMAFIVFLIEMYVNATRQRS